MDDHFLYPHEVAMIAAFFFMPPLVVAFITIGFLQRRFKLFQGRVVLKMTSLFLTITVAGFLLLYVFEAIDGPVDSLADAWQDACNVFIVRYLDALYWFYCAGGTAVVFISVAIVAPFFTWLFYCFENRSIRKSQP
jgi:hypothetical protein